MTIRIFCFLISIHLVTSSLGQTIIKGNLKSFASTDFEIVYKQSALNEFRGETLAEGKTDESGGFSSSFLLASEQEVSLLVSNRYFFKLWVVPNTTLVVDEIESNEYSFSGQAAGQNTFLYKAGLMTPMAVSPTVGSENFEPKRQIQYLDSIESKRWDLYNVSLASTEISTTFSSYCKGEIAHFSNLYKNQYLLKYISMHKIRREDIPSDYYYFWDNFELLDDDCISDSYLNSLRNYVGYITASRLNIFDDYGDREKYGEIEFAVIDSLLVDRPLTKEKLKGEILIFSINYFDVPKFIDSGLRSFRKEFPDSEYIEGIQKKWDKKNKNIFTKPNFALRDDSGKIFDIKSLRGKVVYIDFWGSWCKACLQQIPNSIKLQRKYKDQDVAFLFIDFNDTKEKWLKAIEKGKIAGLHIKAEKGDLNYFKDVFGIDQGFPRYALLDKDGILITSSAPHPNDKDAEVLIDKYLGDK